MARLNISPADGPADVAGAQRDVDRQVVVEPQPDAHDGAAVGLGGLGGDGLLLAVAAHDHGEGVARLVALDGGAHGIRRRRGVAVDA